MTSWQSGHLQRCRPHPESSHQSDSRRIDNMEAVLLTDERTDDLVSTNRVEHGWATRNWPISKPYTELAAKMAVILAVIGCQPRSSNRFVETKAVRWTQWLKKFNAVSILSILLSLISVYALIDNNQNISWNVVHGVQIKTTVSSLTFRILLDQSLFNFK